MTMPQPTFSTAVDRLIRIVETLRSPGGCPWDADQTPESLKPYIIEEAYEVIEAIDLGNAEAIREELGDLLLQVILQARIFQERDLFNIEDVANGIANKLERRHPHVFGASKATKISDIQRQWEDIKKREKQQQGTTPSTLGTLPTHLPALMKAKKLTERASRAGFDWPDVDGAMAKVHEELSECEEAFRGKNSQRMEDELGDLLFAVVNLGRFLDIDAENALGRTIQRFIGRFEHVEKSLKNRSRDMGDTPLEELLDLWDQAKKHERNIP
jgi:MazG family protein